MRETRFLRAAALSPLQGIVIRKLLYIDLNNHVSGRFLSLHLERGEIYNFRDKLCNFNKQNG